ncbi:protein FAM163A [Alosa sapidissima]|uniref:protein FAM163A n=1 Tax=Alosa sapidissima TaxID=34773 RepID=UPI001C09762F|nr:protein FAM163A [Alosa sapidissima]XP_041957862.1 protein FAM163A [Alosa sapidissima]XP_041957872.1 protein FAM163A [Alosa sapidissima]
MTAGTVVITGGILATVILLCIIAVLCYCRLQYYCCKRNDSEVDAGSTGDPQPQFACNACSAPGVDGSAVTPLALPYEPAAAARLPQHQLPPAPKFCPTCSPYYMRSMDDLRNGGERMAFMPAHYENPAASFSMSSLHSAPLSSRSTPDFYTNTRAISTDV